LESLQVTIVIQNLGDGLYVGGEGLLLFRRHGGELERDWSYPRRFPPH
jgi:hypothetical protein